MKIIPKPYVDSDAAHSEYSPSGSGRWMKCAASIQVLRELKREPGQPSFYAEEGTAAHELSAYCLDEQIEARTQIGKTFNNFVVDREMAAQCQKYIDYVNGQVTWSSTLWVENRLSLEYIQTGMFGTADAIVITCDETELEQGMLLTKGELEVIDLKYGKGVVVEVEDNTQLMIYVLGALAHLAKHGIKFHPGFNVKLTIAQPRASHEDGPIRSTYMTVAQLRDFKNQVVKAIALTKEKDPPFGPSEKGCMWCDFGPICKPYTEFMLEVAQLEFADFELPKMSLLKANSMSNEFVSNVIRHSKSIEKWLKSITEYGIEQLKKDKKVKGFKLVYGRSNRAWENQEKAEKLLIDYGAENSRLYKTKFLSPAQAEKELTKEEWALVEDLIFKPTGNVTIAKESDGRATVDFKQEAKDDWSKEEL